MGCRHGNVIFGQRDMQADAKVRHLPHAPGVQLLPGSGLKRPIKKTVITGSSIKPTLYFIAIIPPQEVCDVITGFKKDFAERLNKIAGIEQQQAIIEELDKATYYIERNANSKILFHALTIKLYHIIQDKIVFLAT